MKLCNAQMTLKCLSCPPGLGISTSCLLWWTSCQFGGFKKNGDK